MATSAELSSGLTAIFGSAPTDAQLAVFQSICDTDGLDAAFLSAVDSSGASDARNVVSYYQVFYGRQPDAAGLAFWTGELASGAETLNSLADKFAVASEFNEQFGNRTTTEIVFAQYRNVLGREPDFEGLTFWSNQVEAGNLTLADLGRFFATSEEAQARFDPFVDTLLLDLADGQDPDSTSSLFDVEVDGGGTTTPTTGAPIDLAGQTGPVNGSAGADVFTAESGDLSSSSVINGGGGADTLTVFNETVGTVAVSPRMTGVETVVITNQANDLNSRADNNVGGYNNFRDGTTMVDVELDAGRITGVTRWEDFDSRADLVIEDARDGDDIDGTFTGDLEIAMVSTDPGNVDYAIYFDQPVNQPPESTSTVFLEVLDLDTADTVDRALVDGNTDEVLNDATLSQFTVSFNGTPVTIVLFDREAAIDGSVPAPAGVVGPTATYNTLIAAIQTAIDADATLGGQGLVVSLGDTFNETASPQNAVGAGREIFGRQVQIEAPAGNTLEAVSRVAFSDDPSRAIAARITDVVRAGEEELIRLNIDLDDVGKGSMGGDLLAGAMSTGRQFGDDGTSDSQGIQQFDIEVDRSSQLQTINSTNNALEVVNIVNGENDGPNNTTRAVDEQVGDLVVRGRANPGSFVATDGAMPGAAPQHDDFGFNDVRVIDARNMVGDVDLTLELGNDIIEKYLTPDTFDDGSPNPNADDVAFNYELGTGDDEFLVNMSAAALLDAGTASREDFNLTINGNNGDDTIVTNVGSANKFIDGQGKDAYDLDAFGDWYQNQANNDAAAIRVTGGAGNDSIWTHGWGDAVIVAGFGEDVVYTDNAGTVELRNTILRNISTNPDEHEQVDYRVGAVWTFNDDNAFNDDDDFLDIDGATNTRLAVALPDANRVAGTFYETKVTVSFLGANGDANTAYTSTVTIPDSAIRANGTISEQQLNQAIKDAVNNNGVLSQVLEAVDGPGQSLAVYSKIDGEFVSTDLEIDLFEEQTIGNGAPTTVSTNLAGTAYDTSGTSTGSDFENFGSASFAESDNRIIIDADGAADTTVLSTTDAGTAGGPNLNGSSNELLVVREGTFGVETIFNFGAGDNDTGNAGAEDRFTFEAIDYTAAAGNFSNGTVVNTTDDSISIIAETAANDTRAEVEALYDNAAPAGTTTDHIVIVYDDNANFPDNTQFDSANNTGSVYYVTDGPGANDAVATFQGEIELVGTEWSSLTFDNFL